MGALDELADADVEELDAHLRVLLGKAPSLEQKEAFKAAVHLCMDEYGPGAENEEEPYVEPT